MRWSSTPRSAPIRPWRADHDRRIIDQPGSFAATANPTDLAVRGKGFLPVTTASSLLTSSSSYPMQLTTTGSFRTDANGYLRTSTGLVLLGWPANADGTIPPSARDTNADLRPIQIQTNQFAAEPTTRISLGVNLPAVETKWAQTAIPSRCRSNTLTILGTSQSIAVTYTPTVPVPPATGLSNEWTMVLTDSAQGGATIGEYVVTFDDSTTRRRHHRYGHGRYRAVPMIR